MKNTFSWKVTIDLSLYEDSNNHLNKKIIFGTYHMILKKVKERDAITSALSFKS